MVHDVRISVRKLVSAAEVRADVFAAAAAIAGTLALQRRALAGAILHPLADRQRVLPQGQRLPLGRRHRLGTPHVHDLLAVLLPRVIAPCSLSQLQVIARDIYV